MKKQKHTKEPEHKYEVRTLPSGTKIWYRDGKLHRDGGLPAIVWVEGTVEYWVDGRQVFPQTTDVSK